MTETVLTLEDLQTFLLQLEDYLATEEASSAPDEEILTLGAEIGTYFESLLAGEGVDIDTELAAMILGSAEHGSMSDVIAGYQAWLDATGGPGETTVGDYLRQLRASNFTTIGIGEEVVGSAFDDVLVTTGETSTADGLDGEDLLIMKESDILGIVADGGKGADTYVLTATPQGTTELEECLIFDIGGNTLQERSDTQSDQVVLTGFDADTAVVSYLGDGLVQVEDGTGALQRFRAERPDGTGLTEAEIKARLIIADTGVVTEVETDQKSRPLLIIAEDVEGEALATDNSDTILINSKTDIIWAGDGDDVVHADFRNAESGDSTIIDFGDGQNTAVLRYDPNNDVDVEECLIFDLNGSTLSVRAGDSANKVLLPDFGVDTVVTVQDDGEVLLQVFGAPSPVPVPPLFEQTIRLEQRNEDGTLNGLTEEQVAADFSNGYLVLEIFAI